MDEAISSLEDLCFEKLQIYFLTYPERKINLLLKKNQAQLDEFQFIYNTLYWYSPIMKYNKIILFPPIKINNKFISRNKKSFIESDTFIESLFQNILKISYTQAKKIVEYKGIKDLILWNIYRNYSFYGYCSDSPRKTLKKINGKTCYPQRENKNNVRDCVIQIYEYLQHEII